jgi:ParB family chromosome partitioning protein
MSSTNRLGRGLDALIPSDIDDFVAASLPQQLKTDKNNILELNPADILPNPHQPRTDFSRTDLDGLAQSIKQHGILQPIIVIETNAGVYQLIAGERRLRAAKQLGLTTIPSIVRTFSEQEQLELAVIENIQRSELKPLELAIAYTKLVDQFNMTHEAIAKRVGKGSSTVSNSIRLVNLPHAAKLALQKDQITEGHARAVLSLDNSTDQTILLEAIIKSKLTVREAEEFTRKLKAGNQIESPTKAKTIRNQHSALTTSLGKLLGTKVNVMPTARGGRLVIEYYSDEELARIAGQIQGQD